MKTILISSLLMTAPLHAAVIVSYHADATSSVQSPTLQGWAEGGNLAAPAAGGTEVINSTSYRYWDISNPPPTANASSRFYRYNFTATDLSGPAGWTASAFLRVESAPPESTNAFLEIAYGSVFWTLNVTRIGPASSHINYVNSGGTFTSLGSYDTAADYFHLQMYHDPVLNNLQVYVNGVAFGDPIAAASLRAATPTNLFIRWGDNDGSGRAYTTYSHWNSVGLETGFAVVPEPGSLLALGLGGGVLLLHLNRRKRRHHLRPCAG